MIKFNNGNPVIICDKCRIIISNKLEDYKNKEHLCEKCKNDLCNNE
jgi:formylmethanofuran dehydrogenase subunit E